MKSDLTCAAVQLELSRASSKRFLKCISWKMLFLDFTPQFVNIHETNFSCTASSLTPAIHFQYMLLACCWKLLLMGKFIIITGVRVHSKEIVSLQQ